MADTESIMRLGIEAARAGDKEEARNLFRLLTREQPDNPQSWLWLAGVAEDREEKRAALERVLTLEPTNDLARKGLQALGVSAPAARTTAPRPSDTMRLPEAEPPPLVPPSTPFDTQPFMLKEDPLPPSAPERSSRATTPVDDFDLASSFDSIGDYAGSSRSDQAAPREYSIPDFGDDDDDSLDLQSYMNRPRVRAEDIEIEPAPPPKPKRRQGGFRPLTLVIMASVVIGLLLYLLLSGGDDDPEVAGNATATIERTVRATARSTADTGEPTSDTGEPQPTSDTGEPQPTSDTGEPQPTTDTGEPPPTVQPTTPPNAGELANANPQQIALGEPLNAAGWFYNYPDATFSNVLVGPLGGVTPQGNWVIVLMFVNNDSGELKQLPADFFVLKDAQGRVHFANPDASQGYRDVGGVADVSMKDQIDPNVNVSIPLLFDVPADATDLVIFSRHKTDQGYYVRASAQ